MTLSYFKPEVHEDDHYYYVKIHPEEKDKAKEITGRSWDGEISRWVYPKRPETYRQLCDRLRKCSKSFAITPPTETKTESKEKDCSNEITLDATNKAIHSESTVSSFEEKLGGINKIMESLGLAMASQGMHLKEIKKQIDGLSNAEKIEPEQTVELSLSNHQDCHKLDYFFVQVLTYGCKKAESEQTNSILEGFGLQSIVEFVTRKHEVVREELSLNVILDDHDVSFPKLVHTAKDQEAYINTRQGSIDLYSALLTMNNIRNNLAHLAPETTYSRVLLMGLLYSILLVEVWSHIAPQ